MPTHGPGYTDVTDFAHMVGVTMKSIEGGLGDEQMTFVAEDGRRFVFWYEHDCCASCNVEDICGDLSDLVGSPIVEAEEVSNYAPEKAPWEIDEKRYAPESFTWTFYRFSTAKGTVTIRWLGESNGYYSELPRGVGVVTYETIPSTGAPIKAWTRGVPVEDVARKQLVETAALPFVWPHVAVMPDVHWGMGATVGSVVPTRGAIVPAAVGVDIGCGMCAVRTPLSSSALGDNAQAIFDAISKAIPHGRTDNGGANDRGAWSEPPSDVRSSWEMIRDAYERDVGLDRPKERAPRQLGTLGTGNHFVEVCLDLEDRVWLMLHSGSRGVGNAIGSHYIAAAKKRCEADGITLPNADLAWLPEGTPEFDAYVKAVGWAQDYARRNREVMLARAIDVLRQIDPALDWSWLGDQAVNCHHNYVTREEHFGETLWVTRKGAVSARVGQLGIIPGSMGTRSFIVRGKGNPEALHSCSHGAGRVMSRGAAKKAITLEQHAADTAGVICRKDADVIDESPRAYKNVEDVMAAQSDLVEVVHELRGVVCVKG